ncbi:MAG TPA: hypothetical protein VK194_05095 [Candidatus Deferrimicrobium sp.]|nr:hypothetical protein [Candidatus Deferrimicrobium sp.]
MIDGVAGRIVRQPQRPAWRLRTIDDQKETFFILDVDGQTVIIHVDSGPSDASHDSDLLAARPIIDSMTFH